MEKQVGGVTKKGASKTKIVWTLGPASRFVETIEKLLKAGMNVARFNFSHGSHADHQETLDNLRTAMHNTGILCAVMLDTKGPEIQTGLLKEEKRDSNIIFMSYKKLAKDLNPGDVIPLTVLSCDKNQGLVRFRCENSTVLGERENVKIPTEIVIDLPTTLTEKDKEDILQWGVPNKVDIIALSSVRRGSDLVYIRKLLGRHARSIMLMSKIETQEGYANVHEILKKTDALMVARGNLGMEMSTLEIDRAQKRMIRKANALEKAIVTAIQMTHTLEPMATSPPQATDDVTNAATDDVTNAVHDGTDCVMLSGVTEAGADPESTVQTISRICKEAENSVDYEALQKQILRTVPKLLTQIESTAISLVRTMIRTFQAKAIVVVTKSGYEAELVAKYRPSIPIVSVVDPEAAAHVASRCLVYRGVIPVMWAGASKSTEEMTRFGVEVAKKEEMCKDEDDVVLALQMMGLMGRCPVVLPLFADFESD
ncbi:unnamed protein product [Microthlaspi erraticum]|uniref:Pyruvate kinase n=1 Tax=Microthlaspi erraticum TaxID=1685480 RepID=A0A6D2J747_9BRAS|nr:unnamed protein product [Microthlaspi erraticum]